MLHMVFAPTCTHLSSIIARHKIANVNILIAEMNEDLLNDLKNDILNMDKNNTDSKTNNPTKYILDTNNNDRAKNNNIAAIINKGNLAA